MTSSLEICRYLVIVHDTCYEIRDENGIVLMQTNEYQEVIDYIGGLK